MTKSTRKPKTEILYQETYRKGEANIRQSLLPDRLPYMPQGVQIVSMELRKAGQVRVDGKVFEFQEVYVLCLPPPGELVIDD